MKRAKQPKRVEAPAVDWIDGLDDRLLTTDAAAKFLGYHAATLRKLRCYGDAGPPHIVLPNNYSIRYRLGDLKAWAGISKGRAA
ncbi:helix-turn-helix transcriptional regulator [Lysobacter niastensis]|uniref:DNA-binding protein n=1 Tax=Lysobacter niastensis TaxID=380629 RepID=A0ABS0B2Z7_9GAMM|nr:DNA-binding protein [Lysobacter niastensis]MBF6022857.1 DNA-binding protein [Lysobacter niastensis]